MRTATRLRAALIGAILVSVGLPAQVHASTAAVNWELESPAVSPPARSWAASTYDSNRDRVVVYGGSSTGGADLGDTWEFNGSTWADMAPAVSPPILAGAAMAYDAALQHSILFGGSTPNTVSSDTWEWDGTTWTRLTPRSSPPPMVWTAMAYDSTRGRIVLFGADKPFGVWLSETWEFDGSTWTQEQPATSPSPRQGAAMAFDSVRNRVVMFGGHDMNAATVARLADTWEWDGTNWTQMTPLTSPYARFWHSMAYDPIRDRTILFGGDHISPYSLGEENDTWEWDGAQWARDWTDAAPSVRAGQSMVYDSRLGRMVLFGGFNAGVTPNTFSSETWELGTGIVTAPGNPVLSLDTTAGGFGSVDLGASSTGLYFVSSSGTGPLTMTVATTGDFSVSSTDCPSAPDPLASGSTCALFVTFAPTAAGDRFGTLTFNGNQSSGPLTVQLHGVGIDRDFTIAVDSSTVNTTVGYPVPAVIVSTTAIGDVGSIALSSLTTDPGVTVSFNPSSIAAGATSIVTITLAPSLGPGYYGVRIVGAEGTITHYVDVTVHVFPVPDFTIAVDSSAVTLPHGTNSLVVIETSAINGASSITVSASVSPSGPTVNPQTQYIAAGGIGFLTIGSPFGVAPGAYTVTVTGVEGSMVHSATISVTVSAKGIVNGGLETGDPTGWSQTGAVSVVPSPHSGMFAAQVGSTSASADSTLTQTFDVPASGGKLSFWYWSICSDKVKNDWFIATLQDGVTGVESTVQPAVCTKNGAWTKVTVNLSAHAGHYVTLNFLNHDDGDPATPTYTLIDDVALS